MHPPSWDEGANALRAVADLVRALQWPLVALIITSVFRADIRKLLSRVRKGSLFGAEVELERALDELEEGTEAQPGPEPAPSPAGASDAADDALAQGRMSSTLSREREILSTAAISPRAALMLLSSDIEALLRRATAVPDDDDAIPTRLQNRMSVTQLARDLMGDGEISEQTNENIENLWRVRNLVVHEGQGDEDDVLRAIDSGLVLLRGLRAIDPSDGEG